MKLLSCAPGLTDQETDKSWFTAHPSTTNDLRAMLSGLGERRFPARRCVRRRSLSAGRAGQIHQPILRSNRVRV